uniref:Uncharacterized protein n=1 Tax=Plectus sambesii TaxID=2011161 RepID=A0A914UJY7_9BILA
MRVSRKVLFARPLRPFLSHLVYQLEPIYDNYDDDDKDVVADMDDDDDDLDYEGFDAVDDEDEYDDGGYSARFYGVDEESDSD